MDWAINLLDGRRLTALAASILVYRVTGSAQSVGLMLIATSGPTLVIGTHRGRIRRPFRSQTHYPDLGSASSDLISLIPVLISSNINWLYVIVALTSAITQFFDSAHASILPEVVSEKELSAATSLMAVSSLGSTTVGFAAAGFIATSLNINWAFYLNGISLL